MRGKLNSSTSSSRTGTVTTDTEWSDAEELTAHKAVIFKRRVDDGAAACARGDFLAALRLYEDAIRLDPSNHVLYTNRSAIYGKLGRYQEALADAEKGFLLNPTWIKAYYRKGHALKCMGRYVAAASAFAGGLAQDSKNNQLLSGLIECMIQSEMKDQFNMVYNELKMLGLEKSPYVVVSVVGQEMLKAGHTPDAINVLECALRIGTTSLKLRQSVLSALSTAYYNMSDMEKAKHFMEQDLAVALSLSDKMGEARTHANLGMLALNMSKLDEALDHYRRQFSILLQLGEKAKAVAALSIIGQIYRRQFDYKNALTSHEQCLELSQETMDFPDQYSFIAQQYGSLGDIHLALNDLDEAEKWFCNHKELAQCENLPLEEVKSLCELGSLHQARGQLDEAAKSYLTALKLAREEKSRQLEATLSGCLSGVCELLGKLDAAKKWADRCLQLALIMKDKHLEAKACGHMASIETKRGCLENAKKLLLRQLDVATRIGDAGPIAKAYRGLGVCYAAIGDTAETLRCHKAELSLAIEAGDKASEAIAHGHLGNAFAKAGDRKSAETHYHCQLNLAKETRNVATEMVATRNYGTFLCDGGKQSESVNYFEKYLMLAQERNDLDAERDACVNLGKAHAALGRCKEAVRYYDQALSLAKDLRDHRAMAKAYCELGRVRASMNDFDEALECQKYFLALAHIINDVDSKLQALQNIGMVLMESSKPTVAVKVLAKLLSMAKCCGRKDAEAAAYGQLGRAYRMLGRGDKALTLYLQELALFEQLQDIDGQYESHGRIGEYFLGENQINTAVKSLENQAQLARQTGQVDKESRTLKRIAEICTQAELFDDAARFFDERRRLAIKSGDEMALKQASIDHARCLVTSGQDAKAASAYQHLLGSCCAFLSASETGVLHRDRGRCWLRLRNFRKAAEAMESALDYLERSIVDASVKSDCYRVIAAVEMETGRAEAAVAQLNRWLQFVRSIGFVVQEPQALCDLAFAFYWSAVNGRPLSPNFASTMADLLTAAVEASKHLRDCSLEWRASFLLGLLSEYNGDLGAAEHCFGRLAGIASQRNEPVLMLKAMILRICSLLPHPSHAGDVHKALELALSMLPVVKAPSLLSIVRLLSAIRYWATNNITDARREFNTVLNLCEPSNVKSGDQCGLFDEGMFEMSHVLCLAVTVAFFASQKMDEEALLCTEKLRLYQTISSLRVAGTDVVYDQEQFSSLSSQLKQKLGNLTAPVSYFIQIENIVFSWILTSSFRMSSSYLVNKSCSISESSCQTLLSPCKLSFPTCALRDFVVRLIRRGCFGESTPSSMSPQDIFDSAVRTATAQEKVAPIVIGLDGVGETVDLGNDKLAVATRQASLLNVANKGKKTDVADSGGMIMIGPELWNDIDNGLLNAEVVDTDKVPKQAMLLLMRRCQWLHLVLQWSEDEEAFVLKTSSVVEDEEDSLLTVENILTGGLNGSTVTVSVSMQNGAVWPPKGLVNIAGAFVNAGAAAVVLKPLTEKTTETKSFFAHFYDSYITGASVREAMDSATTSLNANSTVFMAHDVDKRCKDTARMAVAIRTLLRTPEECREALRVVLHLVEKSLQRINAGMTNPMFTSEHSVRNKAGPEVDGCVELLLAFGFKRSTTNVEPVSDALYFPLNDVGGILSYGSTVIQSLLSVPQTALFAISKLITVTNNCWGSVLSLLEDLNMALPQSNELQFEVNVPQSLWSVSGVADLLAALGFDKMRELNENVTVKTIRKELTRKKLANAVTFLRAIFGDLNTRSKTIGSLYGLIDLGDDSASAETIQPYSSFKVSKPTATTAELSGLESDFSADDSMSVLSVVSLAKKGAGPHAGRKKGRRYGKKGKLGSGYMSDGDVVNRGYGALTPQLSAENVGNRGYCSEDERVRAAGSAPKLEQTAQVISVDERDSPTSDLGLQDESEDGCRLSNAPLADSRHEYARLETPTDLQRNGALRETFISDSSVEGGHYAVTSAIVTSQWREPMRQSVCYSSSIATYGQDTLDAAAIRRAAERLNQHLRLPPPSYGQACRETSRTRPPPPYRGRECENVGYSTPRNLAGS